MNGEFDFKKRLASSCAALDLPTLDNAALERLDLYFRELKRWSQKMNLIAKRATDSEILEKHFLDSLTLLPLFADASIQPHLLDIGTGAGFPGLVCKAAMPQLQLTLVEPRQKRVAFLSHIIRSIKLEDITLVDCRVEDEDRLPSHNGFTHITCRAVSEIKVFLDMCSRFMAPGVQVICMKGPKWKEELAALDESILAGKFELRSRKEYSLPQLKGTRQLLVFEFAHI
jgi:16S rRNA (guanine527-N7)-methyltransferase